MNFLFILISVTITMFELMMIGRSYKVSQARSNILHDIDTHDSNAGTYLRNYGLYATDGKKYSYFRMCFSFKPIFMLEQELRELIFKVN
jgi:hypothetical protein